MTVAPRQNDLQVTHAIRYDFTFNTVNANPNGTAATTAALAAAALNAGVPIGTLPAGAVIKTVDAFVDVAFNNGTTNTFSVGFTATGTDLVSAAALGTQAVVSTAAPIAASATAKAATAKTGTPIWLSTGQTGTAATAGQASLVVTYHPPLG
ncbi:MAG TPA: hypothetical protein VHZ26_15070 [Caulobacteraceae bacterium]|jgi:hypothetical protein|nr:hypothetical protein [Caulobacteraceae bacterium]